MSTHEQPERGAAAVADRRWGDAHRSLTSVALEALSTTEVERLAVVAHLVGDEDGSLGAWTAAHQRHLEAQAPSAAARAAFWIGFQLANRGDVAQAGGWFGRAERLVAPRGPCAEAGYLRVPAGLQAFGAGDPDVALEHFSAALDVGRRSDDVDLVTLGQVGRGQALILLGRVEDGLRLLDEAMVAVIAEEVSPVVAGIAYCAVIDACQSTFEVRRAHEWTEALHRWCERQPDLVPYRGQCLVHRAEILQVHGAWSEALEEAERACDRLSEPTGQPALGAAYYQRAELLRLRGEFAAAAEAYGQASRWGRDPQPGLALLRLAEGDVDAAAAAIRRVEAEVQESPVRARVLAAAVDILLAADDVPAAAAAGSELSDIADGVGAPYLDALAAESAGRLRLAEGDPAGALVQLRSALHVWHDVGAPYEAARTRLLVGRACRGLGDEDTAALELAVARRELEELGAAPDLHRLDERAADERDEHGLTDRELEVLRLVSAGATNKEIAATLVLSVRTVERHVSNIFAKVGVATRAGATAFAHRHHLA